MKILTRQQIDVKYRTCAAKFKHASKLLSEARQELNSVYCSADDLQRRMKKSLPRLTLRDQSRLEYLEKMCQRFECLFEVL